MGWPDRIRPPFQLTRIPEMDRGGVLRCRAAANRQAQRIFNNGNDHSCDGQGPARVDRRGHDGLQGRPDRKRRQHGSRAGLAAQEGPVEGRQEVGPRRGRGPDWRAHQGHQGRRGRGQLRDRFRGAQRPVPGAGQDDRPGRVRRRRRCREDQGRQGRRRHDRDRYQ